MGFDWFCDQVGSGHESSMVKYLLKESLGVQSSYFVYFQTYNITKMENVFECCLLLQVVSSLEFCGNAEETSV